MTRVVPFSKNRETIFDFLARARRFHATVTSVHEIDVTELMAALARRRAEGRPLSLLAVLVKATALVVERYPRLNHHLFHGPLGKYEVDFEEICCTVIVLRKREGELVLLPVNVEHPERRSVDDIEALLATHRHQPLETLPGFRGLERLQRLPRPALRLFSYLCRSRHRFYRRYFGTYGISPLLRENDDGVIEGRPGIPTTTFANTACAFIPASVADHPRVVDGTIVARKMLTTLMALDHYLVDGHDGFLAVRHLERLLADPARLGIE